MDEVLAFIHVLQEQNRELSDDAKVQDAKIRARDKRISHILEILYEHKIGFCDACGDVGYYNDFLCTYCRVCEDYTMEEYYCDNCAIESLIICSACSDCVIKDHKHAGVRACPNCNTQFVFFHTIYLEKLMTDKYISRWRMDIREEPHIRENINIAYSPNVPKFVNPQDVIREHLRRQKESVRDGNEKSSESES
jgi:hypothetical protein